MLLLVSQIILTINRHRVGSTVTGVDSLPNTWGKGLFELILKGVMLVANNAKLTGWH